MDQTPVNKAWSLHHQKSNSYQISIHKIKTLEFGSSTKRNSDLPTFKSELRLPYTHRNKQKSQNAASDYFDQERHNYEKNKIIIMSGQLTTRALTNILKPNRLKWEQRQIRIDNGSIIRTKLNVADYILNQKGGKLKKQIAIEQFKISLDSPKQLNSPISIGSSKMVGFMGRMQLHQNRKKPSTPKSPEIHLQEKFFKSEKHE